MTKQGWYSHCVKAELAESVNNPSCTYNPYGMGTSPTNSPIIALGEAWGYHMGHFLADQQYNVNASDVNEAWGTFHHSTISPLTSHPYLDAIEYNTPTTSADPFGWIPKGLMYDLMDIGEPTAVTKVNDQVSGYNINQIFGALQSDVTSVGQYKARLLQQNPNNATNIYVDALFTSYGY